MDFSGFGNTEASNADQKLDPIANGNLFRSRENANGGNISKSEDKPGQRGRGGLRRGGPRQVGRVSFEDSPTQDQSSGAAKLGNLSIRSKTSSIRQVQSHLLMVYRKLIVLIAIQNLQLILLVENVEDVEDLNEAPR
jgi:hypothetical protein